MASSKETYCLCGQPYNIGQFMIECDCCREWFHGSCVDVKIYQSDDIDKYHCPKCSETYGSSVLKIPTNNHRADRYEVGAETRAPQVGTPAWVRWLAARALRPVPAALQRMRPQQFTEEFVRDNGFTRPVMFHTTEGLDMKTPNPATFTVRSVLRFCGAQLEVEVIDVRKQATLRMPLGDFVDYFETPPEHRDEKVLNVLSLEFSDTNMSSLVEPPGVVRALDWAGRVWPPAEPRPPRPAVHKYCLMSAAGAYTDFHIDFGGTTVWYHVLHGRKIFYLIPPTATNLALYQQWSASNNQNERFFGDMVEWYGTAEVCAGQTLVIPSGWVHAVLTPCDALVFGGNLLHSYAIETQLQIYEIERRVETPLVLRYPLFEALHWYAGAHLLSALRRHNEESQDEEFTLHEGRAACAPAPLPPLLLRGLRLLAAALKEWHALKPTDAAKRDNVPKCLNSGQLVRELARELRALDKRSAAASTALHKDSKQKNTTPNKSRRNNTKKSLKLTLPKPIMHMAQNGEYPEEAVYSDKLFIDNKEVVFQDGRCVAADMKYGNGLPETKYIMDSKEMVMPDKVYGYQGYEEMHSYPDGNGYVEHHDKKGHILKIKLNTSPPSSRAEAPPPPPYPAEPSILKRQLVRPERAAPRPHQQWTISKEGAGEYQEEQILFTNDNLQHRVMGGQEISYGPGMYSAEDIQQDYQYSESAKPGSFQPTYGYQQPAAADVAVAAPQQVVTYVDHYQRYEELQLPAVHQGASYSAVPLPVQEPLPVQQTMPVDGPYQPAPLPTYDAAMAHQYGATTTTYVIEEAAPAAAAAEPPAAHAPVRRSVRPVRRRVSTTYDYEDGDLYIDDAPAPRRKPKPKHKHNKHVYRHHAAAGPGAVSSSASVGVGAGGSGAYRAGRVAPTNGIESLIQASVLAEEEPPPPDAVAGMLSISERYAPPRAFGLAQPPPSPPAPEHARDVHSNKHGSGTSGARARRAGRGAGVESGGEEAQDEEDVIKEVHRDEEYVYPSLEMSSEDEAEDEEWARSKRRRSARSRADTRGKADKDESWSPRARLGRLVPRLRGPGRAGVRRECVRAALHAAATHARPHPHPHPHSHPHAHAHARPHQPAHDAPVNAKRAVLASKSRRPPPPVHDTPNNKNIRLKKGMKTAKQRLGKILKLHKMMH